MWRRVLHLGAPGSGGGRAHELLVGGGDDLTSAVDVEVLDAGGDHGLVAAERHRDLVGRVAHEVEDDLDDLGVREMLPETRREGIVDGGRLPDHGLGQLPRGTRADAGPPTAAGPATA